MTGKPKTHKLRTAVSTVLALLMLLSVITLPQDTASASEQGINPELLYNHDLFTGLDFESVFNAATASNVSIGDFQREGTYTAYLQSHATAQRPDDQIIINARDYSVNDGAEVSVANINGREDVLIWHNREGLLTWEFEVTQAGLYGINIAYITQSDHERRLVFGLYINGERPFDQARRTVLPIMWKCDGPIRQDSRGNDIRPSSIPDRRWVEEWLSDKDSFFQEHFLYYFSEGINTITIDMGTGPLAIDTITLEKKSRSYRTTSI